MLSSPQPTTAPALPATHHRPDRVSQETMLTLPPLDAHSSSGQGALVCTQCAPAPRVAGLAWQGPHSRQLGFVFCSGKGRANRSPRPVSDALAAAHFQPGSLCPGDLCAEPLCPPPTLMAAGAPTGLAPHSAISRWFPVFWSLGSNSQRPASPQRLSVSISKTRPHVGEAQGPDSGEQRPAGGAVARTQRAGGSVSPVSIQGMMWVAVMASGVAE